MGNTFANSVYAKKYKGKLSFEQFLDHLNYGMKLLKKGRPHRLGESESTAMEIALDYNMELVLRDISSDDY